MPLNTGSDPAMEPVWENVACLPLSVTPFFKTIIGLFLRSASFATSANRSGYLNFLQYAGYHKSIGIF